MPLRAGRDLNSSMDAYGQRRRSWPLTLISNAMSPTDGRIDTMVWLRASSSCTTSPLLRAEYGCAEAVTAPNQRALRVRRQRRLRVLRALRGFVIGRRPIAPFIRKLFSEGEFHFASG